MITNTAAIPSKVVCMSALRTRCGSEPNSRPCQWASSTQFSIILPATVTLTGRWISRDASKSGRNTRSSKELIVATSHAGVRYNPSVYAKEGCR